MDNQASDSSEQKLLEMYVRLDALHTNIEVNLSGRYGSPTEQARRLDEVKELRQQVIDKLGYTPKSTLDKEIEAMKRGEDLQEPYRNYWSGHDPVFTGPRGGRYRINSNGRKSYDV
ncbi:hypothetical protein ACLM45_05820 [Synechococcus sp. A10-1-5-9]|uniref:hypothetical protein n=1 Tax=Synechococcus sp. A10-1-5-9 TaxID=3392295 RepID=UPI0039E9DD0C